MNENPIEYNNTHYPQQKYTPNSRQFIPQPQAAVQNVPPMQNFRQIPVQEQYNLQGSRQIPTQGQPPVQNPNQVPFSQRPFGYERQPQQTYPPAPQTNSFGAMQGYPQNVSGGFVPYYMPTPRDIEREELRKAAGTAGKTTLFIFLLMQGLGLVIGVVAVCVGMMGIPSSDGYDPYSGFTGWGYYLLTGMLSLVGIVVPSLIILKSSKIHPDKLIPVKKVEGKKLFAILMGGMSVCMLAQLAAALFGINLSLFGIDVYANMTGDSGRTLFDFLMGALCTAIIPGIVEEFAFRGIVYGVLEKHGKIFAIVTSAFLFGMLHGNFAQIPFAFTVGLVLGFVRASTGSMIPCMLIHFGNNFFAVCVTILSEIIPENYSIASEALIMLLLVITGFVAISYLTKHHEDMFNFKKEKHYLSFSERLSTFASNGFIIADTIILALVALFLLIPTSNYGV